MNQPVFGLGAAAVATWLQKRRDDGLPGTAAWLAGQIGVTPSSVHEWLSAGWLSGGSVPKSLARKRLAALAGNPDIERLFDQDDERRDLAKRSKASPSDRPVAS